MKPFNMENEAKEKALELYNQYFCIKAIGVISDRRRHTIARISACIAVREIIQELESERVFERIEYWQEVEKQIFLL